MERQDQQLFETLEIQRPQCSEESQDKNCTTQQLYRSPQMLLVGTARRLMVGYAAGSVLDAQGAYTYP